MRRLAQARLVGERLFDGDGLDALDGDHLREPVHLPVGHLQHAPDIAHRRLRQERAEGDDLPDPVAPIGLLDIGDHLLAAVHAEIDVEIRHRDAVGVQKPLEQELVAQRIEIGDGERIGHEAAGARAAARPHGDVARLGPFDEIGDDQEIAGKAHPLDHAELEIEPRVIVLDRGGMGDDGEPRLEPVARLTAQLVDLVIGKARQDRIARGGPERTAPCDLDGVLHRLGQIGKERRHLVLALEMVLRRQAAARRVLIDIGPVGHAQERVMRLEHRGVGEMHIVGRHQRQVHRIGHLDMAPLGQPLGLRRPALAGMALQLDIEPVPERARQPLQERLRRRTLTALQEPPDRAIGAAGQADDPLGVAREILGRDMRHLPVPAQVEPRVELHQVAVSGRVLRQQHHRRGRRHARPGRRGARGQVHLAAHDRLHARGLRGHGKFQRGEHVVGVGHRHRGHAGRRAQARQALEPHRPLEKRIFAVQAQMDESGCAGHAGSLGAHPAKRKTARRRVHCRPPRRWSRVAPKPASPRQARTRPRDRAIAQHLRPDAALSRRDRQ